MTPRPGPVVPHQAGIMARPPHRHGFSSRINGMDASRPCIRRHFAARVRPTPVGNRRRHRLSCGDVAKVHSRFGDRRGLRRRCDGRAALRHRYLGDRSERAAAGRFLAIRQRQMARGDVDSSRPRRLGHLLRAARNQPAAVAGRDRSDRSAQPRTAANRASSPISMARSWTRRGWKRPAWTACATNCSGSKR